MVDVTAFLDDWVRGEPGALERLLPYVYPELHALASAYLRRGTRPVTLQTTAVVNDLFLKLLARQPKRLESRRHFYVLSARVMRMSLVDHYRQGRAERRGGDRQRVPLHDELAWVDANGDDILAFDCALDELHELDPVQAELVSARFVLGHTSEEAAELTGLSKATVDRRVRLARAWLFQRMRPASPPAHEGGS